MNEFFGDSTSEETRLTMLAGIFEKSTEDQTLAAQAKNNSLARPSGCFRSQTMAGRRGDSGCVVGTWANGLPSRSSSPEEMRGLLVSGRSKGV